MRLVSAMIVGLVATSPGAAADRPAIHLLAPGFEARALPIDRANVNAIALRPGGGVFVIGYDGKVDRLVDSDGDGLEDKVEPYWDRPGLISPIAGLWGPEGLYVTSHRKLSLLVDADGDGRADEERVVATGWPKVPSGSGLVDAMGLARDRDGNFYLGLGCANFMNPYLLEDGQAGYDPAGELGAVLKITPDGKRREVFAGGLRFTYALEFNRRGDLFATDQEGETWLPGGNPLDELDHIQPGRHYGWPPRHDEYLTTVYDEPPTAAFGPQHQSACGLAFNEPAEGSKRFGPASWEGDAFVAGFSRGKVWRVRLAHTPTGYVARTEVFACVDAMVSDLAFGPDGSLYLAAHSGQPDWGTGPQGAGTLYKIVERDPDAPRVAAAWAAGPFEARVAFDHPIDPASLAGLTDRPIAFGEFARAGDRFEAFSPPYKAVEAQRAAARGALRIAAARLEDDGRTLVLTTDPHPWDATYAPALDGVRAAGRADAPAFSADLDYDLKGVEATWTPDGADAPAAELPGWWPHLDPSIAQAWTAGSAGHDRLFDRLREPGRLALRTLVDLPEGDWAVRLESRSAFEATLDGQPAEVAADGGIHRAVIEIASEGQPAELVVTLPTVAGTEGPALTASLRQGDDPTWRPLPRAALVLPWAPAPPPAATAIAALPENLRGGDPVRGEAVFFGERAKCGSCHAIRSKGAAIGPDLSNLVHRDAASVYRDLAEPSATINPDYVPYTVALNDGRVLVGTIRAEGAVAIRVSDTNAIQTVVPRAEIAELRPSSTSIMPVGLVGAIGDDRLRDLMAYLMAGPAPGAAP